ncbi:hypothetical protein CHS0354_023892 [Potamilus streckersoni]|uniref:SMC hinge domain-containing protein n=1 Tax=Potamilus streckersoni TaxID=2493646 RepID=A0AAE0RZK0_9BIVA|nr:hypothetical protein CHS0354_023892 [Potamilus streckersoni]
MPIYWEKIFRSFGIDNEQSRSIILDEEYHTDLWKKWSNEFVYVSTFPSLEYMKTQFMEMTSSELLGAVQAFEIQQPEVAKTKKEGLVKYYGFEREKLKYFEEHEKEDVHIAFGQRIANEYANRAEYELGFEKGQKIIYASLDAFMEEMLGLFERDAKVIWHPYTQMKTQSHSIGIVKGKGGWLFDEFGNKFLDAISSWWVNLHGHSHPYIAEKITEQLHELQQCIFAGFTHKSAVALAERLLQKSKGFSKVFFSDDGSTAVEVALKMAIQYWKNKDVRKDWIVALEGAYHGDTFGAMSVSGRGIFTAAFDSYLVDVKFVPFPSDEERSLNALFKLLNTGRVAAVILEPLIQGASGMRMYSSRVLEEMIKLTKKNDALVILDEVMTGFGRTGKIFASMYIDIEVDVMCLSKGITGGVLPLGATLCKKHIYEEFLSEIDNKTFYHGHSYTGNALSTAAGCASLDLLEKKETSLQLEMIASLNCQFVEELRAKRKAINPRSLGTILALEINHPKQNYLKIFGFKSFANKLLVTFDSELTGIVGPNGCGKTNIVDAVRWALGEQKTSVLRSEKMENVIFNGTQKKKASSMTEVSLTIQNNKKILPSEYIEVTLTRRLYRDGESEYLLNKVPCRLKDITDLFSDTGMGSDAYSVIELKMIEQILSESGNEKRKLFEEAAGITKYKQRRKQAIKKLETTIIDIGRINDIISELEKKVSNLEKQSKRAEKALKTKGRLKELETLAASIILKKTSAILKDLEIKNSEVLSEKIALENELELNEKDILEVKTQLDIIDLKRSNIQSELTRQGDLFNQLDKKIYDKNHRKKQLREKIIYGAKEIDDLNLAKETLTYDYQSTKQLLDNAERECKEQKKSYEDLSQVFSEKESVLKAKRVEMENLQSTVISDSKVVSSIEANTESLKHRIESIEKKIADFKISIESSEENVSLKETLYQDLLEKGKTLQQSKQNNELELEGLKKKLSAIEEKINTEKQHYFELSKEDSSKLQKRSFLNSLFESYEGLPEGIKFLEKESKPTIKGIGTLGDLISTDEEYRTAVEVALAEAASYYVVYTEEEAKEAIQLLKKSEKGRVTFIMLEKFYKYKKQIEEIQKGEKLKSIRTLFNCFEKKIEEKMLQKGVFLTDVVRCNEQIRVVLDLIASHLVITENIEDAKFISNNNLYYEFVTKMGERYSGKGIIKSGANNVQQESSTRIGKREELQQLELDIATIKSRMQESKYALEQLEVEQQNINERIKKYEHHLKNAISDELENERKATQIKYEIQNIKAEIIKDNGLVNKENKEKEECNANFNDLNEKKENATRQLEKTNQLVNELKKEYDKFEVEIQELAGTVGVAQVRLKETEFLIQKLINDAGSIEKEQKKVYERLQVLEKDLANASVEIESIDSELSSLEEEKRKSIEEKNKLLETFNTEGNLYSKVRALVNSKESQFKEKSRRREVISQMLLEFQQINFENTFKADSIIKRMTETYGINLNLLAFQSGESINKVSDTSMTQNGSYSTNELMQVQSTELSNEETFEFYQNEIEKLKETLKGIGAVNELAFEEFKEENERFVFLQNQRNDLLNAEGQLKGAIEEINKTATEKFMVVFEQARTNFIELFRKLFNEGDEADLILTPSEDVLESDIEIIAKPKGKKPQSVNLLSSGEKALTAIALLFAIYSIKPSPFCILDEVDAPLDDANVDRFIKLIKTFSNQTQFIMVTHNKRTMEFAGKLFGITMEEQGVSKLVSVKLEEAQQYGI